MASSLARCAVGALRLVRGPALARPGAALRLAAPLVRHHWNYQYKPGPYPKTPEQRAAAAKKYGLSVEEYEPYPEDEGYGDYPKLPDIGDDSKDPYYPWDFPEMKRNFNEPIHARAVIMREDRYDVSHRHRVPLWEQWIWFLGTIGCFYVIYEFCENHKMGRPVAAKQLPNSCETHYTFETK